MDGKWARARERDGVKKACQRPADKATWIAIFQNISPFSPLSPDAIDSINFWKCNFKSTLVGIPSTHLI